MRLRLFKKRAMWLPTWRGWLLLLVLGIALGALLLFGSHGFLAVTAREPNAKVLVVEAWMDDDSMQAVTNLMLEKDSPYESVWLTGPVFDRGYFISEEYKSYSALSAATLKVMGVPEEKVHIAKASETHRHRTWDAARLLKEDFETAGGIPAAFDVVTLDVHARRSRLVFRKVFGEAAEIGVIALPPVSYDAKTWYRSSAGVKSTFFEVIAYLYERLGNGGR